MPVSVFLIHVPATSSTSSSYSVLIDAGHRSHVKSLSSALSTHLRLHPEFPLKYVFLTHGHHEHTAALPTLLCEYPEIKVVIARDEYPFVVEGKKYCECNGDSHIFQFFKRLLLTESKVKLEKENVIVIESGEEENTIFENAVKVVRTNGHTPGSLSFLHIPSNSLICGDALRNMALLRSPSLSLHGKAFTVSVSDTRNTVKQISERQDVDYIMPAHDHTFGGVPIEKVRELANRL
ncbi:9283_t:CDS:2 [Paraglomus occultum]|uniref:9283_t:CDS:1 n=1 Tax=Paraglomus occultum TaxID=144539 RepID=A0A9N9G9Y4_9GLOM|nr:9283_t:CDS:2 [Paraglomus occultum]